MGPNGPYYSGIGRCVKGPFKVDWLENRCIGSTQACWRQLQGTQERFGEEKDEKLADTLKPRQAVVEMRRVG